MAHPDANADLTDDEAVALLDRLYGPTEAEIRLGLLMGNLVAAAVYGPRGEWREQDDEREKPER